MSTFLLQIEVNNVVQKNQTNVLTFRQSPRQRLTKGGKQNWYDYLCKFLGMLRMEVDIEAVDESAGQVKDDLEGIPCPHHYLMPKVDCIVLADLSVLDFLVDHQDDVQDGCEQDETFMEIFSLGMLLVCCWCLQLTKQWWSSIELRKRAFGKKRKGPSKLLKE